MALSRFVALFTILLVPFGAYYFQDVLQKNFNAIVSKTYSKNDHCLDALKYLTKVKPIEGFHVICMSKKKNPNSVISGIVYLRGQLGNRTFTSPDNLESLKNVLAETFSYKLDDNEYAKQYQQPWRVFTPDGELVENLQDTMDRPLFVFEGGQFIWPGIEIGHKTYVKNLHGHGDVTLETISITPLVFGVDNFLKDGEIDLIQELSSPHLYNSGVAHNDADVGRPSTDWRTSSQYFLNSEHPTMKSIDIRTSDLVRIPVSHQEYLQVLRYEKTQKYDAHYDYFSMEHHMKNPSILELIQYGYRNRLATVFWYMTDVEEGGETVFPMANGLPSPTDFTDCSKGLKVTPSKRKVIIFYSMLSNGKPDRSSLHGGCPVVKGVKWAANKWIWNKPRHFVGDE